MVHNGTVTTLIRPEATFSLREKEFTEELIVIRYIYTAAVSDCRPSGSPDLMYLKAFCSYHSGR